jgi:hypothetical protein
MGINAPPVPPAIVAKLVDAGVSSINLILIQSAPATRVGAELGACEFEFYLAGWRGDDNDPCAARG